MVAHTQDADIDQSLLPNEVVLKPETFLSALANLHTGLDELAWSVTPTALAIHSYVSSEAIGTGRSGCASGPLCPNCSR